MAVYKEEKTNTWKVYYRYTDWQGNRKQTTKRGFSTKREALAWEREQLNKVTADLDMTFESFVETYTADMKNRIKENTWHTKEHIIRTKILPYFAKRKISDIKPKDIIAWQNEMLMMHKDYLRKHKEVQFNSLVMNGILYQHCAEVEQQAKELFSRLVEDMKKAEGVTEHLKETDQMEWVRRMHNIEARAREVVCSEIIYV